MKVAVIRLRRHMQPKQRCPAARMRPDQISYCLPRETAADAIRDLATISCQIARFIAEQLYQIDIFGAFPQVLTAMKKARPLLTAPQ